MPCKLLLWCLPGHPYPPARPHYRRMLTLRAKDAMGGLALTFFRVVIHPAIWGMLLMAFRFVLRNIGGWDGWPCAHIHGLARGPADRGSGARGPPLCMHPALHAPTYCTLVPAHTTQITPASAGFIPEMMATMFLNWPMIYASLYGRFLLLQARRPYSLLLACAAGCRPLSTSCQRPCGACRSPPAACRRQLHSGMMRLCWPRCLPSTPTTASRAPSFPQLDNVGNVIIMNLIFPCFSLASRLGDRASDGLALKLLYGDRARDALTALRVRCWPSSRMPRDAQP